MVADFLIDWDIVDNKAFSVRDGKRLSKDDFAYTPSDEPSTWKLNISDARHVGGALAALGSGGFRGKKVQIPQEARAGVLRKVHAAWKKFHGDGEPPGVKNEEVLADNAVRDRGKKALEYAHAAFDANDGLEHGSEHTPDALHASQVAHRLGDRESHHRAHMGHKKAAKLHIHAAGKHPEEAEEHHKVAAHHESAAEHHEAAMTNNQQNDQNGQNNGGPANNARKHPRNMKDDELDDSLKRHLAEKNRRTIDGFMGLTYRSDPDDPGGAYESESPEDLDYEEEFKGVGLSHGDVTPEGLNPTGKTKHIVNQQGQQEGQQVPTNQQTQNKDWFQSLPSQYQEAVRNSVDICNRERGELLMRLTANMSEEQRYFVLNEQKDTPLPKLRKMVEIFAPVQNNNYQGPPPIIPNFAGAAGGPMSSMTANQDGTLNDDAVVVPPTMNFAEVSKENQQMARNRRGA